MKKFIFLISLLLGLGVFLRSGSIAHAVDLTVTCNANGPCSISPSSAPLFNETNWAPGDFVTYTVTVVNQDPAQSCNLTLNTTENNSEEVPNTPNFASRLFSEISPYYSNTLQNQYLAGNVSLGSIGAGATQIYNWKITFDPNAGNEFQNSITRFNFNLNFTCDVPPTSPPGGGSVQGASAPVCNSTVPSSTPFLTVTRAGANSALLNWTAVTPVTHYMIRYGTTPGNYIYGAPNVGNVTNFTVNFLSANTTYYFQVAGVNNCMPGPWSNEASTRPTGVVLPPLANQ